MIGSRVLSEATSLAAGTAMAALAAVRRGKAVHPHGVVHRATLTVPGLPEAPQGAQLFARAGEHEALVRFSRSIGLPRPLPDLLGLSLRVVDAYGAGAHQDFLLVTSIDAPILHHVFVPAGSVDRRPYSSSLPYAAGGEEFLVGALPTDSPERFHLAVAAPEGRFRPVAEIRLGARLPGTADALRFNPWNTGGGLRPSGLLNRWRARAYPMSQAAWGATREGGRAKQQRAERVAGLSPSA
jgi:hypothetical protein